VQERDEKIYPTEKVLQSMLRILQNDNKILDVNKQNIIDFQLELASEVGMERRAKYI